MNDFDHPPHATTAAKRNGRPPLSEVPLGMRQFTWAVEVPGPGGGAIGAYYTEKVVKIVDVICEPCSLLYRAWEDDPRPCPGCSRTIPPMRQFGQLEDMRRERDEALGAARQLGDKADSMRKSLEVARTERDEAARELEAARRVVNVVRDRKAVLGNGALGGVEQIRALMAALDEYVAACGGPAAAMKIMEQVEKERTR